MDHKIVNFSEILFYDGVSPDERFVFGTQAIGCRAFIPDKRAYEKYLLPSGCKSDSYEEKIYWQKQCLVYRIEFDLVIVLVQKTKQP